MKKMRFSLPFLALAVLATSLPALAETFTVVLKNGSQFETRYRPTVAEWDESKVLLVTATGNRISLSRDDVDTITANDEIKGYAKVIDTTTVLIGLGPNDAPVPSDEIEEEGDILIQVFDYLRRQDALRQSQVANVEQFVDPPVAGEDTPGGFPVSYLQGALTWDPDLLGLQGLTPELARTIQGLPSGGQFGGAIAAAAAGAVSGGGGD